MSSPYAALAAEPTQTQRSAATAGWKTTFGVGRTETIVGPSSGYGALAENEKNGAVVAASGCCSKGACSTSAAPPSCSSVVRVNVSEAGCCATGADGTKTCSSTCESDATAALQRSSSSSGAVRDGGPVLTWLQLALFLGYFSVVWNLCEAAAGLYAGIANMQFAVLANAGQSGCEVVSAVLVLWRLQADAQFPRTMSSAQIVARERKGIRIMGVLFCALSLAVIGGCIPRFISKAVPSDTLPGLIVSAAAATAMIVCFFLKRKASKKLNSSTLAEDANCSLFCFQLSVLVILGSLVHLYQPQISDHCSYRVCDLWWVDSSLACALSLVIFRDGVRSIRVSYDASFDGGCGCCSGAKKQAQTQAPLPSALTVDDRSVSPAHRINRGEEGPLSHPCASSSDLVEERLEERTASPSSRSGRVSAHHSEDDEIDVYDD